MTSDPTLDENIEPGDAPGDADLYAALRRTWTSADPVPASLADAMIATVAADDLGHEYALLTLVESDARAAVRGDADMLTLQFGDGLTNVLVHVTVHEGGRRRLDGWVDREVAELRLIQEGGELRAASDGGRFSFDDVPAGIARVRIVLTEPPAEGAGVELLTPRFEL